VANPSSIFQLIVRAPFCSFSCLGSDVKMTASTQMMKSLFVLILTSAFALNVYGQEQKQNPQQDSSASKTQTFDARSLYLYPSVSLPLSFKTGSEGLKGFLSQPSSAASPGYVPGFLRLSLTLFHEGSKFDHSSSRPSKLVCLFAFSFDRNVSSSAGSRPGPRSELE